jgi:hypothetical protein
MTSVNLQLRNSVNLQLRNSSHLLRNPNDFFFEVEASFAYSLVINLNSDPCQSVAKTKITCDPQTCNFSVNLMIRRCVV